MNKLSTTQMSSKGQIVIPESIRSRLNLIPGTQFIVLGEGDTVILKSIQAPDMKKFSKLREEAKKQAKKAKLRKSDLEKTIGKVRKSQ